MRTYSCSTSSILVLLVAAMPAHAQSDTGVRGQIRADINRSALANTRLTLQEDGRDELLLATTDDSGAYAFSGLRPGTFTLTTEHDGFVTTAVRFVLKPRELKTVDLTLAIRPVQEQVEVRVPVTLASTFSPSSSIVNAALLDALPAAQRTALPDAIVVAAPGMIRGHDDFVHVRGQELALNPIINGVSFWENGHAVFSGGISPDVIDTANVMTGGFPAEYGNRFGGVVDIVTKSGFAMNHRASVAVNTGESRRNNVAGEIGGHGGAWAIYGLASAFESDRFLSPPDPLAIHDHGHGSRGFVQLDATPAATDSLRVTLMADGTSFDIPVTPVDERLRPAAKANEDTRQQTAIFGWSRTFSTGALLHTSVYERWSRARLFPASGPLTAIADTDRRLLTFGVKSDFTITVPNQTIRTGIDLVRLRPDEHLSYDGTGFRTLSHLLDLPHVHVVPVSFDEERTGGEASVYAQDAIRLSDAVTADVGVRVDRYGLIITSTHASPRVNLACRFGPAGTVAHLSYNHFFVPPPVENVLSSSAGLTRGIAEIGAPLPALPATVENQFEAGVTQPFRSGVQVGATSYYRRGRDEVHTTIWPDARIYSYASFDRSTAYGLETRIDAPLKGPGLSAYLNYALGRVYFYGPVTGGFMTGPHHIDETGRFLAPMDQTHTLTGGITYRHTRTGVWGGVAVEYGSGTPVETEDEDEAGSQAGSEPSSNRVPGHLTVNLSVGADVWRHRKGTRIGVRLNVENLTNNLYKLAQESVFTPGQYSIPRLISGGFTVRF